MKSLARLLVLLACLLAGAGAGAATPADAGSVAIPRLAARVTDLTGTLTAEQRASVEAELAAFESRKGAQIAVLMLPTTGPEPIEAFGIRLAETWKIGRKGIDDGVILIVAKDDRRLRIEVGYGLEGALNDATAKRIVSDTITPAFRQGDFAGGITAGLRAVMAVIDGEALPAPAEARGGAAAGGSGTGDPLTWLFGAAVLAPVLHAMLGLLGSLAAAAIGAAAGWWMFDSWIAAGAGAAILFALSFLRGGPGFMGGGGRGGGFGGGFGGGGGGFGGGGASGRW